MPEVPEAQHRIRRGFLQCALAARGAERIPRAVGKFCVLFLHLGERVFYPPRRRVQHGHAIYPLGQHLGPGQRAHGVQLGQRLRRGLPEGMRRGQHQKRKRLHAPVGGAGGVVVFRHHQIRVGVADGQHAAVIGDGLHRPPVEMPRDNALDNARREHRQFCRRAEREKCRLCKAVGLAAAIATAAPFSSNQ